MNRLRYAAIWLLDKADDLTGHRSQRFCQWIVMHPWWGQREGGEG